MLQLVNETPLMAAMFLLPDPDGVETLYVVVKGTFAIDDPTRLLAEQVPIRLADEYWDEPVTSSIRYAGEAHPSKPGTDVVLIGNAWSPDGVAVSQLDVELCVADRRKTVRVFGDRVWREGVLGLKCSSPEPFQTMPLRFERAFGGPLTDDDAERELGIDEVNPVGIGYKGSRSLRQMTARPLPNLEDPDSPIRGVSDHPQPSGFGFVAPHWPFRRRFAGTYDETWQRTRAPLLPADFDSRFLCSAHPDWVFQPHLEGGEEVLVRNASRRGEVRTRVPVPTFRVFVQTSEQRLRTAAKLESVTIEPDEERICATWKSAFACGRGSLKTQRVDVEADPPERETPNG